MLDFKEAFLHTLQFEDATRSGRVTVDAGGRTRFGIAEKFHPDLDDSFFSGSTEEALAEAEQIERREYWTPLALERISHQDVANKLFDMAINMGVRQAAVFAQRAANALLADGKARTNAVSGEPIADSEATLIFAAIKNRPAIPLVEDGEIGPLTLAAINGLDPVRYLQVLRELSAEFYRHVASINPAQGVNLAGWLRRAAA